MNHSTKSSNGPSDDRRGHGHMGRRLGTNEIPTGNKQRTNGEQPSTMGHVRRTIGNRRGTTGNERGTTRNERGTTDGNVVSLVSMCPWMRPLVRHVLPSPVQTRTTEQPGRAGPQHTVGEHYTSEVHIKNSVSYRFPGSNWFLSAFAGTFLFGGLEQCAFCCCHNARV